ncbi:MAG: PilZ domain-containing protein [Vicinamibacteria bacterium]|nr:PilZ domain-containing protein [Vicinamibacteria bacterium]
MSATILVTGLDVRGLLLDAPLLRREGYSVEAHDSVNSLTEQLLGGQARLVVLGTYLPDQSLTALVRTIRSFPAMRRTSILCLIPAGETHELERQLLDVGANAALRRPLDPLALDCWLAKLLTVAHRVNVRIPVEGHVVGSTRSMTAGHFCATTRNISVHGALLASPVRLDVGVDLELDLRVSAERMPLHALGRIVRETGDLRWPYLGYGVEFLFMSSSDRLVVERLVDRGMRLTSASSGRVTNGIHSTLRRNRWIYEVREPAPSVDGWQVEIRRSPRDLWRPGQAGPYFVVSAATPMEALLEARRFLRMRT